MNLSIQGNDFSKKKYIITIGFICSNMILLNEIPSGHSDDFRFEKHFFNRLSDWFLIFTKLEKYVVVPLMRPARGSCQQRDWPLPLSNLYTLPYNYQQESIYRVRERSALGASIKKKK